MSPIFILAQHHREAQALAHRYELSPREWTYVHTGYELRGTRRPQVIKTRCWWHRYVDNGNRRYEEIARALVWSDALVAEVDCR